MRATTHRKVDRTAENRAHYEQIVIGQLLKAPDQLDRASILSPSDFSTPNNRAWLTKNRLA